MKFLFMSKDGDGLGIAQKIVEEGNEVRFWIQNTQYEFAGQGIVERVTTWRPHAANWADFVVADMVGFGHFATVLDQMDVQHLGFNLIADMMELDRRKQMQLFRKVGINIPETHEFETPMAARDIVKLWGPTTSGFVIKPSGNIETAKTYVTRNPETFLWALEQYSGDQDLIVQRFEEGVEVSTEGWFNGEDWVEPFNHTFEEKRFLEGGGGPNTGCMGNVVTIVRNSDKDRLVKELKKLTPFLRAADFKGPIDLNCIVNERGIFALELTARFGYDAIEALHELMHEKLGAALVSLAAGGKKELRVHPHFLSIAVRLSVPPFPHAKPNKEDKGLPIIGLPKKLDGFYLTDVMKDKGQWKWAAGDGVLMKVTAAAPTVKQVRRDVYEKINNVSVNGLQFRRDIGERVEADLKKLKKLKVL